MPSETDDLAEGQALLEERDRTVEDWSDAVRTAVAALSANDQALAAALATAGDPSAAIADHEALPDPHAGYATDADLSAHGAAANPHPVYLTQPEGDARYSLLGAGSTVRFTIGDGVESAYRVPHGLTAPSVIVEVWDAPSGSRVLCDLLHEDANNLIVSFASPAGIDQYLVAVTG